MKPLISIKIVILILFFQVTFEEAAAQVIEENLNEEVSHSETQEINEDPSIEEFSLSNLPYFIDDLMIIVGINSSNAYWSNHFNELSNAGGFQLGVEGFLPLGNITFVNYGMHYAQRNFRHGRENILFKNNYLDFPLYASFMLPEFRTIDLRFFLGAQFSYRLSTNQSQEYQTSVLNRFEYDETRFNRFDTGMTFGLSGERGNFFFRLRSFVGISRIDRMDQGAMSTFYIEGGYFLFRGFRQ